MSLSADIKTLRLKRKDSLDAAGAILTKAAKEKNRPLTAEENTEFDKRHVEGDAMLVQIGQFEKQLDATREMDRVRDDHRPAGREDIVSAASLTDETREQCDELRKLELRAYMVNGVSYLRQDMQTRHAQLMAEVGTEYRALSAITGTLGQDTIPSGFVYTLDTALKYYGGIVDAADYIDTDSGAPLPYPSINDTANTGELAAENTQVAGSTGGAAEQDPTYGIVNLNAYMFDTGFVLVPIQLIQDSAFDVDKYLNDALAMRIGRKLNLKCTVGAGAGSSEPKGFIPASVSGLTAAGAAAITYNDILGLLHSVDPAYRNGPKTGFMFNDSVLLALRKLVDGNGRPLFVAGGTAEGIQNAQPDRLFGKQYWINQDMAGIATTNKSMAFGDFSKYKIRRVRTLQLVRAQERFIDALQIGFLAYQRFDGNLIDAGTRPIKFLTQA